VNRAFHTFALAPVQPDLLPVQAGPPVLRTTPISSSPVRRVDPVGRVWSDLDTTQRSMLAVHGAILLAVTYHGFRRNHDSIGWALVWSLGGFLCPTVTMGFAMTQGFAKPQSKEA